MERRKFLIGTGALASGSAAAVGTGAFTSVSADRTVSVQTTGDQSAFLAFEKATNADEVTENAEEYVVLNEDETVSFDFTEATLSENGNGSGVNKNATTIFDDLVDIVNQGTQEVLVGVSSSPSGLGLYSEGDDAASDSATQDDATAMNASGSTEAEQELAPGERIKNVGVIIRDASAADGGGTITFSAEAINNND
ncbi:hypothetical protein ACOJIV_24240 [Haloarcula sp. AONF1]